MWNFFTLAREAGLNIYDSVAAAPDLSGYYLLFSEQGNFIYVGKASQLRSRLLDHFSEREDNERIRLLAKYAIWQVTPTEAVAQIWEGRVFDQWVRSTGESPIANINWPPNATVTHEEMLAIKWRLLFGSVFPA